MTPHLALNSIYAIISLMNTSILAFGSMSLYLIAATLQGMHLWAGRQPRRLLVLFFGGIAFVSHAYLLYQWIDGGAGQNLTYYNVLSQLAWLTCLLILVTAFFKPTENLTVLIFPFAAMSIFLVSQNPGSHIVAAGASHQQLLHIFLSLLAFSMIGLAALQAILLTVQERQLRMHQGGGIIDVLPPLETMEVLLFQMLFVGFVLLTSVLVTNLLFFDNVFASHVLQKTVLASLAWFTFAVLLLGRLSLGWRGKTAVSWTLGGTFLLMLSYFGGAIG